MILLPVQAHFGHPECQFHLYVIGINDAFEPILFFQAWPLCVTDL